MFLVSSVAKAVATVFTYPVLSVRVKLQTQLTRGEETVIEAIKRIVKESGLHGLYLGFGPKLFQTLLYNGFLMITYEKLKRFIKLFLFALYKRRL